ARDDPHRSWHRRVRLRTPRPREKFTHQRRKERRWQGRSPRSRTNPPGTWV
ncbi:MAG: hypothetical protein AVDCRST_MAG05-1318, partial [uncultured Rubrobacteraceae bacterium]